jgi:UMF1 family MFS transporter
VTFVYAAFFSGVLVGDSGRGDVLWSHALTVTGVAVALLSPWLGAVADQRRGRKRRFLIAFSGATIACTLALVLPQVEAGQAHADAATIWTALALFTVANIAFELAFVFYNAFLPELGDTATVGRLSGKAWAIGYAGGLCCLAIGLCFVGVPDGAGGFVLGPWLDADGGWNVRATNLLVAGWFLVFALPMFCLVQDRGGAVAELPGAGRGLGAALREVLRTIGQLRDFPDLLRLLVARLFYNDAVIAIIGLAALYMERTLGMAIGEIIIVAIWLNVAAGLGAFGFGYVDDRVGARAAILASLLLLIAGGVLAIAVPTVGAFWVAATLVGIGLGPNQAASRSLMARFAPAGRSGEFYGLFALSGKATTWIGPLLFGIAVEATGSQRIGLLPLIGMLGLGFALLLAVDERRGTGAAGRVP